jgi:hypothetical protein
MARIRTIKPDFWKSESIAALPFRTRLTFIGLWTYVDDNGVGLDNFKLIAAELSGLEDDPREARANVREDLARLHSVGRIVRYTVSGKRYFAVVNWTEHQKIDKPGRPRYPSFDDDFAMHLSREEAWNLDGPTASSQPDSRESREGLAPGAGKKEQGEREQGELLPPPPPAARTPELGSDADPDFCKFWDAYPLKVSKKDARLKYVAALKKGATAADIIAGAEQYRDRIAREGIPRDKIKHPDGWLNGERWKDEAELALLPPSQGAVMPYNNTPHAGANPAYGAPTQRSPAEQRLAEAMPLYEKYKRQEMEQETARG